jgi:hypothetical protein
MAITQISRIQHRRGLATDLPQLAAGELGWVIDEQRLFIGNGTVADGAPAVGNTEIITAGSATFTTALSYFYKGYLGASTPIVTGASGDFTRTVQAKLDDFASVKDFGALGDGTTNDTSAIQRALDELYTDTDRDDERARRILYFPAGDYRINASLKIPPYAHLRGEGIGRTVIYMSASAPVAVCQDDEKNTWGSIGSGGATTPTNITAEGITFQNGSSYGGVSLDNAVRVKFTRCEFRGAYAAGGADNSVSKGVTVRSTTALPCSKIVFDNCRFSNFARLADLSYDATNIAFNTCDFSTGRYGVYVGEAVDGSTNGLTIGPKDVKICNSSFETIYANGIRVDGSTAGADSGTGEVRNVVSFNNFFARSVGTANDDIDLTGGYSPIILFNADECSSLLDYFDGTQRRSTSITPIPEVQGIGSSQKQIRQITLADNTSAATTTGIRLHVSAGKKITVNYKIVRSTGYRVGTFTVNANGTSLTHNDDYEENSDVGVTLSAVMSDEDSSVAGNETVTIKYTTTSTGNSATMDHEVTEMV